MSGTPVPLGDGRPWTGGRATAYAVCVLAPNPGPMTLEGTNTWVLADAGSDAVVLVDPGPALPRHVEAVAAEVGHRRVARILLTHGHPDHAEGAAQFAGRFRAPVAALDPAHRLGDEGLVGGDVVAAAGVEIEVVATPGHTADSLTFRLREDGALLTGDTVLGRGTTVVAHPEGRLEDYLASLRRLGDLAAGDRHVVLPGHGPALEDAAAAAAAYLDHRRERLEQVRAVLEAGAVTADDVVAEVYADVPRAVWPAARLSVLAQIAYLRGE